MTHLCLSGLFLGRFKCYSFLEDFSFSVFPSSKTFLLLYLYTFICSWQLLLSDIMCGLTCLVLACFPQENVSPWDSNFVRLFQPRVRRCNCTWNVPCANGHSLLVRTWISPTHYHWSSISHQRAGSKARWRDLECSRADREVTAQPPAGCRGHIYAHFPSVHPPHLLWQCASYYHTGILGYLRAWRHWFFN